MKTFLILLPKIGSDLSKLSLSTYMSLKILTNASCSYMCAFVFFPLLNSESHNYNMYEIITWYLLYQFWSSQQSWKIGIIISFFKMKELRLGKGKSLVQGPPVSGRSEVWHWSIFGGIFISHKMLNTGTVCNSSSQTVHRMVNWTDIKNISHISWALDSDLIKISALIQKSSWGKFYLNPNFLIYKMKIIIFKY